MTPIRLVDAADAAVFGGKASSLAAALQAGLPVPDGWALSVDAVRAIVEGAAGASDALAQAVAATLPAAVRSSAIGEDSAGASFAGQHATVLNVTAAEQMRAAVHTVWESGNDEGALAYRRATGITGAPSVAAVVQRMVLPSCAGVMFTRHPLNGAEQFVIEASYGLGEAVVAGLVTPDFFCVSRSGEVVEQRLGEKDVEVLPCVGGGTEERPINDERAETFCLDGSKVEQLTELARLCEQQIAAAIGASGRVASADAQAGAASKGLDIEWAFANDELYLIQCRPITTTGA